MTEAQIKAAMRRGIFEPSKVKVSDGILTQAYNEAITQLGLLLKKYAPDSLQERRSINSTTHIFDYPSDCDVLLDVWDLRVNAGDITGATNASPIVITEASHGRATNDIVTIHGVLGNTAANGTWKITKVDANSYSLNGSTGNAAYTSGGKVFKESTDFLEMTVIPESESTLDDDSEYFTRNSKIVVDDVDFTYDLLITYIKTVSALTDIPTKHHIGLVAWGVMHLVDLPEDVLDKTTGQYVRGKDYDRRKKSLDWHTAVWDSIVTDIRQGSQKTVRPARGIGKCKPI